MTILKLVLIFFLSLSWFNTLQAGGVFSRGAPKTLGSLQATDLERVLVIYRILNLAAVEAGAAAAMEATRDEACVAAWIASGEAARGASWAAKGTAWAVAGEIGEAAGDVAWAAARDAALGAAARQKSPRKTGIAAANAAWKVILRKEDLEVTILKAIRAAPGWKVQSFEQAHISDANLSVLLAAHKLGEIYTPISHPGAREFVRRSFQNIIMSHPNYANLAALCEADFWPRRRDLSEEEYQLQREASPGNSAAARFFAHGMCDRSILPFVGALLGNRISE